LIASRCSTRYDLLLGKSSIVARHNLNTDILTQNIDSVSTAVVLRF
jgi:hypothetical protein